MASALPFLELGVRAHPPRRSMPSFRASWPSRRGSRRRRHRPRPSWRRHWPLQQSWQQRMPRCAARWAGRRCGGGLAPAGAAASARHTAALACQARYAWRKRRSQESARSLELLPRLPAALAQGEPSGWGEEAGSADERLLRRHLERQLTEVGAGPCYSRRCRPPRVRWAAASPGQPAAPGSMAGGRQLGLNT